MVSKKRLNKKALDQLLSEHKTWTVNKSNTKLSTTIQFDTHTEALAFLVRATVQVEVLGHHPDVMFSYKKLKITTTTHDSDGLTLLDKALVEKIDDLKKKTGIIKSKT